MSSPLQVGSFSSEERVYAVLLTDGTIRMRADGKPWITDRETAIDAAEEDYYYLEKSGVPKDMWPLAITGIVTKSYGNWETVRDADSST